jgi:tRNA-dihydrouridine synthase
MIPWRDFEKPLFVLAPMADVTDRAYRAMVGKYSGNRHAGGAAGPARMPLLGAMWDEFVSCDGLAHPVGRWNLLRDLQYHSWEGPVVAQLFGGKPENFEICAALCVELGFQYIDINMGCPDKTINNQGAGAWLIQTPDIAKDIIHRTRRGASRRAAELNLPNPQISVKTRIGWTSDETDTWIPAILSCGIDLLTVHARTRKEMSDPPPHWDVMKKVVDMAHSYNTPVLANGAMVSLDQAREVIAYTGADGAMIGKGTFGRPWFFDDQFHTLESLIDVPRQAKLAAAIEHTKLWMLYMGDVGPQCAQTHFVFGTTQMPVPVHIKGKSFAVMKKNYREYLNHFAGAKELRTEIMEMHTPQEVLSRLEQELQNEVY